MLEAGVPLPKHDLSRGQGLLTRSLVLGEITLLREERSSQHLNPNPPSF